MSTTNEQYDGPEDAQQDEEELPDEDLEDAAGGTGPFPPKDEDDDGTPDILESTGPTNPNQ